MSTSDNIALFYVIGVHLLIKYVLHYFFVFLIFSIYIFHVNPTDKPWFKSEPTDVNEEMDKKVSLSCDVDGNPKPEIVWTHQDSQKVRLKITKIAKC